MTVIDQTEDLRHALADHLIAAGCITSPQVAAAFRAVPRHLFTPEVPREQAYRPYHHVRVKYDARGATISSVSAPYVQAIMLEQAHLTPGMRCLEIGSGGCNAALMAELVGPGGQVTTVDIDADIVARARRFLADAGYPHVHVVHADAAQGVPQRAPFDRIIVTAGVWDVPPAWREQLTDDGCIVLPLRMRGLSRSVALVRDGDRLVSLSHHMAGFVPMQGADAYTERQVPLHGDHVTLRVCEDDILDVDGPALSAALQQPRVARWSGVTCGREPIDQLYLWLATSLDWFGLLASSRSETAAALVRPIWALSNPTLVGEDSFAYLTLRDTDLVTGHVEFGAYAHGPQAAELAEALVEQIRVWDRHYRYGPPARISIAPASTPVEASRPGVRVIRKRHTTVTITWPPPDSHWP